MAELRETALNFGPSGGLVGILTRPAVWEEDGVSDLAVIIINSGIIHRVGPNRLHVGLARTLASRGTACFRIDLPGIGDSQPLGTGGSVAQESLVGITTACDLLELKGVARRFVLFGLCSGADYAFMAACADPRVVGIVMVDPTRLFVTWKAWAIRVLRWAVRPAAWLRLVRGRYRLLQRIQERLRPADRTAPVAGAAPGPPSDSEVRRLAEEALKGLVARGVRSYYVITGDQRHRYNYRRQLFDAFPDLELERLTHVEIFAAANHTLPRDVDRARLEATVADWIAASPFPRPMAVAAGTGSLIPS